MASIAQTKTPIINGILGKGKCKSLYTHVILCIYSKDMLVHTIARATESNEPCFLPTWLVSDEKRAGVDFRFSTSLTFYLLWLVISCNTKYFGVCKKRLKIL